MTTIHQCGFCTLLQWLGIDSSHLVSQVCDISFSSSVFQSVAVMKGEGKSEEGGDLYIFIGSDNT